MAERTQKILPKDLILFFEFAVGINPGKDDYGVPECFPHLSKRLGVADKDVRCRHSGAESFRLSLCGVVNGEGGIAYNVAFCNASDSKAERGVPGHDDGAGNDRRQAH